jgi:selenide,water dikinase
MDASHIGGPTAATNAATAAGPTTESPAAPLRLTDLTDCGGCAAKLGADLLADALAGLGADAPADLLVGLDPADDAAAYLVAPELAILGTVDFFPPLVDDPETYGAIAAANAVSDIFAMGGRVLFALSVASLPEDLPREAIAAILTGASATVRAAGGTLAGGHTIRDPEPTFGLAVIGAAHPDRLLRKGGARPGDVLLLTKPLGTGLLVSGGRAGRAATAAASVSDATVGTAPAGRAATADVASAAAGAGSPVRAADGTLAAVGSGGPTPTGHTSPADLDAAIASMCRLNRAASEIFVAHGLAGATDVTGFGLLGHGWEMARAASAPHGYSGMPGPAVRFVFDAAALPALPGALDVARAGVETGGAAHNRRFVAAALTVGPDVAAAVVALAHDPQTSGGLLAAVPPGRLASVTAALDAAGEPWWRVGHVEPADAPAIALV